MSNNLIVSYDLFKDGQDYNSIIRAINLLGRAERIHFSLWFVKSNLTAEAAAEVLSITLDKNDSLFVADLTNNSAFPIRIQQPAYNLMLETWNT